jgi:hypothetical protein
VNETPRNDDAELRGRLERLLKSLQQTRDQNPATIEALLNVFPELAEKEPAKHRPLMAKLKQWLGGEKAA